MINEQTLRDWIKANNFNMHVAAQVEPETVVDSDELLKAIDSGELSGWVSVEDPPKDWDLFWCELSTGGVGIAAYLPGHGWSIDGVCNEELEVIRYHPLPTPPKQDKT